MKRTLFFFVVFCGAVSLLLIETADRNIVRADDCKASASVSTSRTKNGEYLISSDVTSRDCVKLACGGFVHYLVSYHVGTAGKKDQAHALNEFEIEPAKQQQHIQLEYAGPETGAVIDSVTIESVSCLTTAP